MSKELTQEQINKLMADMEQGIKDLPEDHQFKVNLEQRLEEAKNTDDNDDCLLQLAVINKILNKAQENQATNDANSKEIFSVEIPEKINTAAEAIAQSAKRWWNNKLFGFHVERKDGKFSLKRSPKVPLALEDLTKPKVRDAALRDAPDLEAAEAILEAKRAGNARKQAEDESNAEKARRQEAELQAKAVQLATQKEAMQKVLDEAEFAATAAEADAELASERLTDVTGTVRLLEDQINTIDMQTEAAKNKTTALQARTKQMNAEREEALKRTPELETQLKALRTAFEPVEEQLNAAQAENDQAETALNEAKAKNVMLQGKIDDLKRAMKDSEATFGALRRQINQLNSEAERRGERATLMLKQLEELTSQHTVVKSNITLARKVVNAANLDKADVVTPEEQKNLFLNKAKIMAEDGTTAIAALAVRKAKNMPKGKATALRMEVVAGDLTPMKGAKRPENVNFLSTVRDDGTVTPHARVGQNSFAVCYKDETTGELVLRTQSAYPMSAKVVPYVEYQQEAAGHTITGMVTGENALPEGAKETAKGKALLVAFEADDSNRVPAFGFTLMVKL